MFSKLFTTILICLAFITFSWYIFRSYNLDSRIEQKGRALGLQKWNSNNQTFIADCWNQVNWKAISKYIQVRSYLSYYSDKGVWWKNNYFTHAFLFIFCSCFSTRKRLTLCKVVNIVSETFKRRSIPMHLHNYCSRHRKTNNLKCPMQFQIRDKNSILFIE